MPNTHAYAGKRIVEHNGHGMHRYGRRFYFFHHKQQSTGQAILTNIFKDDALYCQFSIAHLLTMKNFDALPKIAQKKDANDAQNFIEATQRLHQMATREIHEKHDNVQQLLCAYVRKKCIEKIEKLKPTCDIEDLKCKEKQDTTKQKRKKKQKDDHLRLYPPHRGPDKEVCQEIFMENLMNGNMFERWHGMIGEQIAQKTTKDVAQEEELHKEQELQAAQERKEKDKMIAELTHEVILGRVSLILLALKAKSLKPFISHLPISNLQKSGIQTLNSPVDDIMDDEKHFCMPPPWPGPSISTLKQQQLEEIPWGNAFFTPKQQIAIFKQLEKFISSDKNWFEYNQDNNEAFSCATLLARSLEFERQFVQSIEKIVDFYAFERV